MRYFALILILGFILFPNALQQDRSQEITVIVEIDGSPALQKKLIEGRYPSVEIVATYHILFQGLALKGKADALEEVTSLDFIKATYPVQTYEALKVDVEPFEGVPNIFYPSEVNPTGYTGKGVKVAVIDTGIDFNHPDLRANYNGGFDLVDLDNEPMETTKPSGLATYHGTHVAGIIGANGTLKGVAPDSEIFAYRALGPGGMGTSIQVIAAMEEAMKEGVDVMNLSLGNTVNGPDYPTSVAVNVAAKRGVAIVVANGNDGPKNWTVGAPATAATAISVGAYQESLEQPQLYDPGLQKEISLTPLNIGPPWQFTRDYMISQSKKDMRGKIAHLKLQGQPLGKEITAIEKSGAVAILIDTSSQKNTDWLGELAVLESKIPVALVSKESSYYLKTDRYYKNRTLEKDPTVAEFSSRGPVTVNWMMKPDILAPGVNIVSTVPGGYKMLSGTSMAAPHITGAIAVVKEAHPEWSNEEVISALKTTAVGVENSTPISQGAGNLALDAAVDTEVLIENPLLSFGKTNEHINDRTIKLKVRNLSDSPETFTFKIPKREKGITWHLPQIFTVGPGQQKEIPIGIKLNTMQAKKEFIQGHVTLEGRQKEYFLPYMVVNKRANFPKVMGFSFGMNRTDEKKYQYQLYVAERVKSITIQLYDPDTLKYMGELATWTEMDIGMNEGELKARDIKQAPGFYNGLIVVKDENGNLFNTETEVLIE